MVSLPLATAVRYEKLTVSILFIYPIATMLPKLAVLSLYHRIFTTRAYRYAILVTATVIILTWLSTLLIAIFICHPFGFLWKQMEAPTLGGCGDLPVAYCAVSIPNLLTDIAVLVIPMYAIWHLHARTAQKIGLMITFLTGSMCVSCCDRSTVSLC